MSYLEKKSFLLEENIKKLFNNIPIPSYVWQKIENDFVLVDYNNAAEKDTNGIIKDYLNKNASEVHSDRPDILDAINECFTKKKSISKKSKYLMKTTGEQVYISIKIHYLPPNYITVHIRDISQWKLADEKLKNSEEKYKLLFDRSPIPIALTDLKGTLIDCNLATENQFGYLREDIIGKNYFNLGMYSPTLIPRFRTRLSQIKEGKPIEHSEFEIYKKDGSKSWIVNHMSLVNLDDKPMIQSFIIDITESKNFEQKIERKLENEKFISTISSRLLSTLDIDTALSTSLLEMGVLIGATRAYILLFNEEGSLEFYIQEWCADGVKPQMINLTGINETTFPWIFNLGRKNELIHIKDTSELQEEAINLKKELLKLNINSVLGFPIKIKNESFGYIGFDNIHHISNWDKYDFDILRTTSEIIGNALERKWAEETLKSSHQLLAGIISSLTETIYLVDTHYNIGWANNAAKQLFGMHITGKKCYKVFAHRGKPCTECNALKTFTDGKVHEDEKEFTTINSKKLIFWCTSSTAGLNLEGETELAIMILRDITTRKSMEKTLINSEKNLRLLNQTLLQKVEERTKELRKSEEIYRRILNDLEVGFYKGEFKGKLLMHNIALNKILGLAEDISLVGSQSSRFLSDPNEHKCYYRGLLDNGHIINFITKLKKINGEVITVQLNSHLIRDDKGNPIEVEGTVIKIPKSNEK
ncbi:MAG: PAS domain S-box protein [Candidatus Lokiarchaeota archaeon]|nr:PAS domain S-box protein [Candidatus Lokiarchaeota archaeon]